MSFYDATVPAYLQILGALSGILGKAEAHCKAKNIQEEVLLSARLYPDMFPLTRQIQTACDFAVKAMQMKFGLPADPWPTAELLAKMRGPRSQPTAAMAQPPR